MGFINQLMPEGFSGENMRMKPSTSAFTFFLGDLPRNGNYMGISLDMCFLNGYIYIYLYYIILWIHYIPFVDVKISSGVK